ncbi:MAG: peptidase s9b dipeptidylpeptidase iv domain [Lasallia pustulata]|uniref:dipeptidyl-peptidase IV n=1 Tax=Lasallia pustulata TaxID=136370 RepID=A0A5M8PN01_9LECA|nr:MAG: peptidase s9b dipeptidylpeptidase iv domain [Lasallia pustulata]
MSSSYSCRAGAQSVAPKYERPANSAQRVKNVYKETTVSPQWLAHRSFFWYRRDVGPGQFSFVSVDAEQAVRRPAFNHERLAKALNDHGVEAQANEFPFTWIDPSSDGEFVKFRIGEKKWQFRGNGPLTEYDGEINEETLKPMRKERPSDLTNKSTVITFLNRTKGPISLFWIDWDGTPKHYVTVEAGQSNMRETYTGHVWRVMNSETEKAIASFIAGDSDSIAVIEEGMTSVTEAIEESTEERSRQPYRPRLRTESSGTQQQPLQAFVRDYNVWVRDADGQETQLSTSGTEENPFDDKIYRSPDGRFAVAYQYTPEQDHTVYQVESSPKDQIQPRSKHFQYLKPGDRVRIDRPKMFDLAAKKEVATDDSLFQNPFKIEDMGWSTDGKEYWFLYNQRGHQVLRIIGMDTQGGVRSIIEETSKTFIDYSQKVFSYEIRDSNELIWASERDGWNHLYLFDFKTGKMKNRITEGEWIMRSVERVDEEKKQIWFRAFGVVMGQDPYYAQLVRVNFDGSGFTMLTEGDGTHTWKWSPDWKYLIDTWSRVDLAPQTVLRDAETAKEITVLEEGTLEKLLEAGWTAAERFAAPGRDGETMIYGIIIRPSEFDASKKYPVIEQIYAGPQDFFVPKAFSTLIKQHELAELGFVVVQIDGTGTNWRSKAFHDRCYKNLKDAGLPDRIAWMTAASESRPWMDMNRVGIYGSSAGGQSAMSALIWHGDFYKAAVADCGCHDNRMDKLWWNEQWMGWPVDQSYEDSSNVLHAGKLRGALMLIVGELDTNVDPASTMQVVNALNEAGKDYDLLFIPGGGHCVGSSSQYAVRRQRDFLVRHLMGVEPPQKNGG